ncbi:MAG: ATP-binding region, ATPase domain protein [Candidatus Acidoferrum typicum]|nr:ATP-binding region, ATPase domain protein [Candidatus Acidoferrum typicum]
MRKMGESRRSTDPRPNVFPKRVLVVDDNPHFLLALRIALETHGYAVCGEAADGVATIEQAKDLKPDLVLLDLAMPRLNGMETAAVLKNLMPRLPIVMLTFHDDQIKAVPASAFGIKAVISKTDGMSKLIECLDGLVGREVPPVNFASKEKPSETAD